MMDKFYEQFKTNLENRGEPDFDPQAWTDMISKLDQDTDSNKRLFPWWWIGIPAFFMLLLGNYLLYNQLSETNQRLETIETQRDTIIKSQTIVQIDTIYQIKTIFLEPEIQEPDQDALNAVVPQYFSNPSHSSVFQERLSEFNEVLNTSPLFNALPGPQELVERRGLISEIATLDFYPRSDVQMDWFDFLETKPFNDGKGKPRLQDRFIPDGVGFGINGGPIILTGNDLNGRLGYKLAAETEITFGPNWSLWLKYERPDVNFKSSNVYQDQWLSYPTAPDDFILNEMEAYARANLFGSGLNYRFKKPGAKWTTLAGAGIMWSRIPSFRIEYKFENEFNGDELEIDTYSEPSVNLIPNAIIQSGIQYAISEHLALDTKVDCIIPALPESERLFPAYFSATVGLKYYLNN